MEVFQGGGVLSIKPPILFSKLEKHWGSEGNVWRLYWGGEKGLTMGNHPRGGRGLGTGKFMFYIPNRRGGGGGVNEKKGGGLNPLRKV